MARIPLAAMWKRQRRPRRKSVTLRQIAAPSIHASNLYAEAYAPIVTLWTEALPSILAEYERSLASMTQDSPASVGAVISKVAVSSPGLFVTIRAKLEAWAARIERWQRGKWRNAVLAATDVDLLTLIGPQDVRETLGAVIERNVALVSSVSSQTEQRISEAVFRGLTERKAAADVGREIREAVDMSRRRALNIAADQTTTLAAMLNEERRRQAGIDTIEWIHSAKRHPRPVHLARNHALFSENSDRVGTVEEGKTIRAMPPADDMPGVPINCGCTSRSVVIID